MKEVVVYTSKNGHTAEYARLLGAKTGLAVYELKEAVKKLDKGAPVIYLGWLFANNVKGYKKANKRFDISCVCAVGLCDTGTALDEVRKANGIPKETRLFTMQGGMDKTKLRGINKLMIKMLTKAVESKQNKSKDDERMLCLLKNDKNYVSEENTTAFMEWFSAFVIGASDKEF